LAIRRGAFRDPGSGWLLDNGVGVRCFIVLVRSWFGAAAIPEHPDSGFKKQASAPQRERELVT
jgi:hypothetical protein